MVVADVDLKTDSGPTFEPFSERNNRQHERTTAMITLIAFQIRLACIAIVVSLCGCTSIPTTPFSQRSTPSAAVIDSQLSLGRLAERRSDYTRAKQIYQKVIKENSDNAVAHHRIGVILAQEGRLSESLASFQSANQLAPSADILADIGYAYFLHDDLVKADKALRESLEMEPQNKRALNNLALVTGRQGNYAESLDIFRRCNDNAGAHANLAYVMTRNGDLDKATDAYHRALDHDSTLKMAAHALVQFKEQLPPTVTNPEVVPNVAQQIQLASYTAATVDEPSVTPISADAPNPSRIQLPAAASQLAFGGTQGQADATSESLANSLQQVGGDEAEDESLIQVGPYSPF